VYAAGPVPFELQKPVKCAKAKDLLAYFESEYGEKMQWVAKDGISESYFALLTNKETNTYTIVQFDAETACVLGAGKQVKTNDI
jgi:hypothetical protein